MRAWCLIFLKNAAESHQGVVENCTILILLFLKNECLMSSCSSVPGRGIHWWWSDTVPQFHSHSFSESGKPRGFLGQSQRGEISAPRTLLFGKMSRGLRDIFGLMPKSNLRIKLVFLNWTLFCLVQIILDNKDLECHATTTNEIKECCRDIRVLGRKELRLVVWNIRKKIGFVVGPKYFDRTYNRYRGIEFFSFICRLLLSWRSKLRRYLSKKLKMEAKGLQDEIK